MYLLCYSGLSMSPPMLLQTSRSWLSANTWAKCWTWTEFQSNADSGFFLIYSMCATPRSNVAQLLSYYHICIVHYYISSDTKYFRQIKLTDIGYLLCYTPLVSNEYCIHIQGSYNGIPAHWQPCVIFTFNNSLQGYIITTVVGWNSVKSSFFSKMIGIQTINAVQTSPTHVHYMQHVLCNGKLL